jgi:signal transduction histidine kinase
VPEDFGEDVGAVLRESLTNVARHAGARSAEIELSATPGRLTIEVRDDGVGLGSTDRRSGLENLRRRAHRRGGSFDIRPREPRGTCLFWSVPLG